MSGTSLRRVVIVGASLAGLRAAEQLRSLGFDGTVTMVGAEPHLPYDRPPLSKAFLAGTLPEERIVLRKPDDIDTLQLEWRLGTRATALDLDRRTVSTDTDPTPVPFDGLVIATGGTPRWPGSWPRLTGMHALRTLDDARALRADLDAAPRRVVVIGAGFIGAEVAGTARAKGLEVTVVEAAPVPLTRGLGPVMGAAVSALHRDHGVDLRTGVGVAAIRGDGAGGDARVTAVVLTDGTVVEADVVVVGIGVAPETGWLESSGLELRDGVVCDAALGALGTHGVVAAGDLTRWPNPFLGEEVRVEHWTNAAEQGPHAVRTLLDRAAGGAGAPYAALPFFWSDQYDRKVQFLGRAGEADEVEVVLGSFDDRRFVAVYHRHGRLTAALGLGMPKYLMRFRPLLLEGADLRRAREHAASLS